MAVRVNLGQRLLDLGIVTEDQIQEALRVQAETKEKLGTILTRLGFCSEEDVGRAMATNLGLGFISLNNRGVNMDVANMVTPVFAQKNMLLPVAIEDGCLMVAMQNPNDIMAVDNLRLMTGYTVKPIVVSDEELRAAIEQFVNMSTNVVEKEEEPEAASAMETEAIAGGDDESPAVRFVNQIIANAVRSGTSDIHFEPQEKVLRVRFRIDGVLHEVAQQPVRIHPSVSSRVKVMGGMDIAERRIPQDGRATVRMSEKTFDIRIASLPSVYGEKLTLRMLERSNKVMTMPQLGFPPDQYERFSKAIRLPYGFILVTGPTGSGKSTTLYASLAEVNSEDRNIITLEDPVERRMAGINQIQMNARAGMTFSSGLRSILRSDPDILMIGEIRDEETAKIAVESALTGHLVFSTLHTNDAPSSVTRLGDMGVEPFLTSSSLLAVVAQRLLRVLCPRCKTAYTLTREQLLESLPDFPLEPGQQEVKLYRPKGCLSCNNTGYAGRRGAYEFLVISDQIRRMILERASTHEIRDMGIRQGMRTLRMEGLLKVQNGETSVEELLRTIV
ncbi:MAG: Flp pilus assembly complex ATPase component TadA [Gracilibacteraceae bacterium]|jgi:type IV pilus assembly protein PilB|nr:Flp pilus assembly complex ATPase component TadA [Gracilibacteraceae bacterium]